MKQIFFCAAALCALSACARVEPIDLNEVEDVEPVAIENVIGDSGPALDANLTWRVEDLMAMFGPDDDTLLSLTCTDGSLEVVRYADGTSGAGTLTFGGGDALASVAVAAGGEALGGDRYTALLAPGDIGDDLVAVFASGAPIDVTMTGVDPLIMPADAQVAGLVAACIEREAPADDDDAAVLNAVS